MWAALRPGPRSRTTSEREEREVPRVRWEDVRLPGVRGKSPKIRHLAAMAGGTGIRGG